MLAVFNKTVAKCPEELKNVESLGSVCSLKQDVLIQHFSSIHPNALSVNLGSSGFIAFSSDKQNPLLPRAFSVVDDIFCLFNGHIENIASLKQLYGLTKTANEVSIIIEAYRSLRDRGSSPADHALRNIEGKFAFVIFDSSTKSTFIAVDADGSVPLFWGTDSEDHLVLSDNAEIMQQTCGRSFAPFPQGCFFTSSGGLKSYEHPRKVLKAVPWVDGSGQACGSTFVVSEEPKIENKQLGIKAAMPRVGSDADWASHI
ncbi:stem-specific protein TSJT1-like [Amaranthus tricolor]|uniref:stem-specific protein TSJT1-like n=1 Tax=Amaranthus tricolor TaxID=29722 RepID=UPI002589B5C3|nr:stem-specific protein TSJT1-like [Amaranthus tricolor]